MPSIQPGKYQHFKGPFYEVLFIVKHSETLEELVVYKKLENQTLWARPLDMFCEKVEVDGQLVARFKKVK